MHDNLHRGANHMLSGDAQLLEEGWTIPKSSMCMLELYACNVWTFRCESEGTRSDWRASSCDVVSDVVQRWLRDELGLCKDRELGQDGSKLIGGFSWEDGVTGCCDQGGNALDFQLCEGVHQARMRQVDEKIEM